ncbi:polysaccharide biosynthesis/export family protein [Aureimonas mangrovi]|uniref:polysaccharide biosynthesis/export family protein n=1 Tax=Aureimonas mangrovi TaxID=2758041 RepID=UPI00163DCC62|nr:polysaccharide biosynthesis/export family protein [Aureimonas mangrovi]
MRVPRALAAALALGALLAVPAGAQEGAYTLGPMDMVKLRVAEWQTAEGAFRDWSSVTGDYSVSPSGTISIPFIGELAATGRTTAELGKEIGDALQQRFGLADRPEAAVEIGEFRPIYVSGDVQTPGALPFAPDLTVIKALSMAGGHRRAADAGLRVERDLMRAQGEVDVLRLEHQRLLMRRARLQAELDGAESFEIPAELAEAPAAQALHADELSIMRADRQRIALQKQSLEDLKELLQGEVEALTGKRETMDRQLELSRSELVDVGGLAERGLVVNTRVSELERRIAEYEGRGLDIDTAMLRARQDMSEADQDLISLENDRIAQLAEQRQQADAQIEAVISQAQTQANLVREAALFSPAAAGLNNAENFSYSIVRTVAGEVSEFAATENTAVQPGDVVKVRYDLPASLF